MNVRPLVAFCLLGVGAAPLRDADACSCMAPSATLLTPDRIDDTPLNARVRVEMPSYRGPVDVVLRAHGGAEVPVTSRSTAFGVATLLELTPKSALAPSTRYEVAYTNPARHPSTTVFGTFATGDARDTTAPRIDRIGTATPHKVSTGASAGGVIIISSCSASDPWITVDGLGVVDPGRPKAQVAYAVWRADASGRIDDTKPPAAILLAANDTLTLGRTSTCDPHAFALPDKGVVLLGVAAVDEAGNKSATQRLRVDMSAAVP